MILLVQTTTIWVFPHVLDTGLLLSKWQEFISTSWNHGLINEVMSMQYILTMQELDTATIMG